MKKVTKEFLEEAKRKYPVGTVFNSTSGYTNCEIKEGFTYEVEEDGSIQVMDLNSGNIGRIWNGTKWAQILKSPIPKTEENNYSIY